MAKMEEQEIRTKLKNLKKEFDRNEARMRQAAIDYESLMAEKETLLSGIADLRRQRAEKRQRQSESSR